MQEPEEVDSGFETPKNLPLPTPKPKASEAAEPEGAVQAEQAPLPGVAGEADFNTVILRGLNKVTARAQTIEATIGSVVRFGTIEIVAHRCWKSAPEERPENAALLEISEVKQGEPPARIFMGWMFSSSPALSALEHPFYDVTVVRCAKEGSDAKEDIKPQSAKPAH